MLLWLRSKMSEQTVYWQIITKAGRKHSDTGVDAYCAVCALKVNAEYRSALRDIYTYLQASLDQSAFLSVFQQGVAFGEHPAQHPGACDSKRYIPHSHMARLSLVMKTLPKKCDVCLFIYSECLLGDLHPLAA